MWADVGLSKAGARLNPLRWSGAESMEGLAAQLGQHAGCSRPVRLCLTSSLEAVLPNVDAALWTLRRLEARADSAHRCEDVLTKHPSLASTASGSEPAQRCVICLRDPDQEAPAQAPEQLPRWLRTGGCPLCRLEVPGARDMVPSSLNEDVLAEIRLFRQQL